jgi:hypothetical protein
MKEVIFIKYSRYAGRGWTFGLYTEERGDLTRSIPMDVPMNTAIGMAERHRDEYIAEFPEFTKPGRGRAVQEDFFIEAPGQPPEQLSLI